MSHDLVRALDRVESRGDEVVTLALGLATRIHSAPGSPRATHPVRQKPATEKMERAKR